MAIVEYSHRRLNGSPMGLPGTCIPLIEQGVLVVENAVFETDAEREHLPSEGSLACDTRESRQCQYIH